MRRFFLSLFFVSVLSQSTFLFAQNNVNVDLLTGTADVKIPVYTIQIGDINVPIFFYYRTSGIKVEDYDQQVGLGWRLNIDAGVTRILRGFPDDIVYQANTGYPAVKGWLQSGTATIPTKVENFSIAGGITTGTCANEVTDYSYMNTNFPYYYDTEPDKFMVNAPGLNLEFVFDKNGTIRTIPFQDVRVTKTTDANGQITSFTVINDKGVKYIFDKPNNYQIRVDDNVNTSTLPAFSRNYLFYKRYTTSDSYIQYTGKWCLTSITDANLSQVYYNYDIVNHGPAPVSNQKVEILKYNPSTSQFDKTYLYTESMTTAVQRLRSIVSTDPEGIVTLQGDIQFTWVGSYSESQLSNIKLGKSGVNIVPTYSGTFSGNNNTNSWGRYFLMQLNYSGIGLHPGGVKYSFAYQNVDDNAHTSYCTFSGNDSITNAQDYWGYFNGAGGPSGNSNLSPPIWVYPDNSSVHMFKVNAIPSYSGNVVALPGANRAVTSSVTAGTLTQITYPTGGTTSFSYDNQEYFDNDLVGYVSPATNNRVKGGGVRVRSITNNDGISGTNETTYYDYDDASGYTSGRAISVPSFAFAIPNSTSYSTITDKVNNSTYRALYSFSDENPSVIYGMVTIRKTNGGKSVYEFNTAGTWGGANDNEWYETMVYATRNYTSSPSPCNAITPDFLKNNKNNYPFPPNPDYDFQRGLLTKVTNYNEPVSGVSNKISEESYTYARSHTTSSSTNPETLIKALKFDDISGGTVRGYARYDVVSSVTSLLSQKITKVYTTKIPYDAAAYTTETENYTYPTTGEHRQPIQASKTNSDGTVLNTYIQYAKDYQNPSSSGDVYSQALNAMQAANQNRKIETYRTVTPSGGSEKIIAGDITAYKRYYNTDVGEYMNMQFETWRFASQAGLALSPSSFKSVISGSSFQQNSGYLKTATIDDYDYGGSPICITNTSRVSKSILFDHLNNLKVAEFDNAKNTEIIYSPFDYNYFQASFLGYSFTDYAFPGRKSKSCLNLTTSLSIYRSVTNASSNTNLIFSCWLKDAASAGTLTINLSTTGLNANYTISFAASSNWTYYEIKIPKPTQSSYTVTVSTSAAIKIDDALFYPGNASVKTYSYDTFTLGSSLSHIICTAETGMGGSFKSYEYDTYGRLYIVRDGFNNILEVKTYKLLNNW